MSQGNNQNNLITLVAKNPVNGSNKSHESSQVLESLYFHMVWVSGEVTNEMVDTMMGKLALSVGVFFKGVYDINAILWVDREVDLAVLQKLHQYGIKAVNIQIIFQELEKKLGVIFPNCDKKKQKEKLENIKMLINIYSKFGHQGKLDKNVREQYAEIGVKNQPTKLAPNLAKDILQILIEYLFPGLFMDAGLKAQLNVLSSKEWSKLKPSNSEVINPVDGKFNPHKAMAFLSGLVNYDMAIWYATKQPFCEKILIKMIRKVADKEYINAIEDLPYSVVQDVWVWTMFSEVMAPYVESNKIAKIKIFSSGVYYDDEVLSGEFRFRIESFHWHNHFIMLKEKMDVKKGGIDKLIEDQLIKFPTFIYDGQHLWHYETNNYFQECKIKKDFNKKDFINKLQLQNNTQILITDEDIQNITSSEDYSLFDPKMKLGSDEVVFFIYHNNVFMTWNDVGGCYELRHTKIVDDELITQLVFKHSVDHKSFTSQELQLIRNNNFVKQHINYVKKECGFAGVMYKSREDTLIADWKSVPASAQIISGMIKKSGDDYCIRHANNFEDLDISKPLKRKSFDDAIFIKSKHDAGVIQKENEIIAVRKFLGKTEKQINAKIENFVTEMDCLNREINAKIHYQILIGKNKYNNLIAHDCLVKALPMYKQLKKIVAHYFREPPSMTMLDANGEQLCTIKINDYNKYTICQKTKNFCNRIVVLDDDSSYPSSLAKETCNSYVVIVGHNKGFEPGYDVNYLYRDQFNSQQSWHIEKTIGVINVSQNDKDNLLVYDFIQQIRAVQKQKEANGDINNIVDIQDGWKKLVSLECFEYNSDIVMNRLFVDHGVIYGVTHLKNNNLCFAIGHNEKCGIEHCCYLTITNDQAYSLKIGDKIFNDLNSIRRIKRIKVIDENTVLITTLDNQIRLYQSQSNVQGLVILQEAREEKNRQEQLPEKTELMEVFHRMLLLLNQNNSVEIVKQKYKNIMYLAKLAKCEHEGMQYFKYDDQSNELTPTEENKLYNLIIDYSSNNIVFSGIGEMKIYIQEDGSFFSCTDANGEINGLGAIKLSDGYMYRGNFINGKKHGYGLEVYSDGSQYEGQFIDDKASGLGAYTDSNGNVYYGNVVTIDQGLIFVANQSVRVTVKSDNSVCQYMVVNNMFPSDILVKGQQQNKNHKQNIELQDLSIKNDAQLQIQFDKEKAQLEPVVKNCIEQLAVGIDISNHGIITQDSQVIKYGLEQVQNGVQQVHDEMIKRKVAEVDVMKFDLESKLIYHEIKKNNRACYIGNVERYCYLLLFSACALLTPVSILKYNVGSDFIISGVK